MHQAVQRCCLGLRLLVCQLSRVPATKWSCQLSRAPATKWSCQLGGAFPPPPPTHTHTPTHPSCARAAGYKLGQLWRASPVILGAVTAVLGSAAHGGLMREFFLQSQSSYLAAVSAGGGAASRQPPGGGQHRLEVGRGGMGGGSFPPAPADPPAHRPSR